MGNSKIVILIVGYGGILSDSKKDNSDGREADEWWNIRR